MEHQDTKLEICQVQSVTKLVVNALRKRVVREKANHESYSAWKHWQLVPSQDYLLELFGHSFTAPCLDQRRDKLENYFKIIPRQGMQSA